MTSRRSARAQFIVALGVSTLVSISLFVYTVVRDQSWGYSYLIWNLFLAWLPLLFAFRLRIILKHKLWSTWEALAISILWIIFLPNSFYMISDFIHLQEVSAANVLFDAVMFTSFIYIGVLLGFTSLYIVHMELRKRFKPRAAGAWIGLTLFISSIAIYIGRDLRWNSWDVLTNPGGLLFDISDRLQHPSAYPEMGLTVTIFFMLLASMYFLVWRSIQLFRTNQASS